jgi:hypothetical protein
MYTLPIDPQTLALVQQYGRQRNVPLVSIHSAGFYSYFRIHLPGCFPIIDTHPDSTATTDLRLLSPWPALSEFAKKLTEDINSLSAHDHGHIPFVVLLLYYLGKWKESHGGFPSTFGDKKAFREFLSAGARTDNPEGGEENYDEAAAAVLKTVSAPGLSSSVKAVFDFQPSSVGIQSLQYEHTTYQFCISGRVKFEFLDNSRCYQEVLPKVQPTSATRLRARYEGPIECLRRASEYLQNKGPPRRCRSP